MTSGSPGALQGGKVWRFAEADATLTRRIAEASGLPTSVAAVLVSRGWTDPDDLDVFLRPRLSSLGDPFLLPGMEAAVERILRAVVAGETIVVYGDYDVDGVTSTALMCRVLQGVGARVHPFLPLRLEEGYGLSIDGLARCIDTLKPGLIVTVDCGTGSVEAVRRAAAMGVDVVVTDHHQPGHEVAPAVAVVNPKLGHIDSLKLLAGVGVAFKLCHALLKRAKERGMESAARVDLKTVLDLVALGTIADIVPLEGENRVFARHGLHQVNRTVWTGLRALADVAGITGAVDAYEVGFRIGPRLNAAGRLGDAQQALELLLTEDLGRAMEIARDLDSANRERQDIEAKILREAVTDLDTRFDPERSFGLVAAREGWHPGVIGIVASRLVARYSRPVVCVALEEGAGRGSGRSVEGVDLVACLDACSSHLAKHGGHAMAAGLELKAGCLESFREAFNGVVADRAAGRDLRPVQRVDACVSLADVHMGLVDALQELKPFGMGNPTPVWAIRRVRVVGQKIVGQSHLRLTLASGAQQQEAIGFGMAGRPIPNGEVDVAVQVKKDVYMGREKVSLVIQDLRPAQQTS